MGCAMSMFGAWLGLRLRVGSGRPRRFAMVIAALPLFLIAALRYDVGMDYLYTYVPYFQRVQVGRVREPLEPLYHLLNQAVARLGGSYVWVFALCAALFLGFLVAQIFRDSPNPVLSMFLVVGTSYYFIFLNGMRQMVGCAIAVYAIRFIHQRRLRPFLCCMALAVGFHTSCLAFLPMYWVARLRIRPRVVVMVTVVILALHKFIGSLLLQIMRQTDYAGYIGSQFDKGETGYIILAINVVVTLLAAWQYRDTPKYRLYFNLQVLSMWIAAFSGEVALIGRLRWLFGLPSVILLPMALAGIRRKDSRRLVTLGLVACYIVYITITIGLRNGNNVLPYQTIFSR